MYATKLYWISSPFGIFSYDTSKISVCFLYLRLFGAVSKWRKRGLWFLIVLSGLIGVATVVLIFVQCRTPAALWNPAVHSTTYCIDPKVQSKVATIFQSLNCGIDCILALLPITFTWNLRMSVRKKVGLTLLLSGGMLSAICAAIKTYLLHTLEHRVDYTWATFDLQVWGFTEIFLIIVCGSVPTLTPVWDRCLGNRLRALKAGSHQSDTPIQPERRQKPSYMRRGNDLELTSFEGLSDTVISSMGAKAFGDENRHSCSASAQSSSPISAGQDWGSSIQVTRSFQVEYSNSSGF
ncbi:hypothetical protein F4819DRAFT_503417 [Hypoxylon fuscum]|nr:hypothetical protein F4819DRAFT_503417 [Hypoxylon fuscum]